MTIQSKMTNEPPINQLLCGVCTDNVNDDWTSCDWCGAALDRWGTCIRRC